MTISAIAITDFTADRIFQWRDTASGYSGIPDGTLGRLIQFSGTYTGVYAGTPFQLRFRDKTGGAQAFAYANAASGFTASGGNWSGTWFEPLSSQNGLPSGHGWMYAEIKDPGSGLTDAQGTYHGVGEVFGLCGDSHMWIEYHDGTNTGTVIANARRCNGGNTFVDIGLAPQAGEVDDNNGAPGFTRMVELYHATCHPNLLTCWIQQGYPGQQTTGWQSGQVVWSAFDTFCNANEVTDLRTVCFDSGVNSYGDPSPYTVSDITLVKQQFHTKFSRDDSSMLFVTVIPGQKGIVSSNPTTADGIRQAHYDFAQLSGNLLSHNTEAIRTFGGAGHYTVSVGTLQDGGLWAYGILYAHGLVSESPTPPRIVSAWCQVGSPTIRCLVSGAVPLVLGTGASSGTVRSQLGTLNPSGGQSLSSITLVSGVLTYTMSANRGVGETITIEFATGNAPYDDGSNISQDTFVFDTRGDLTYDDNDIGRALMTTGTHPITVSETLGVPVFMHHYKQQMAA